MVLTKNHYSKLLNIPEEYLDLSKGIYKTVSILNKSYPNLEYNIVYCEGEMPGQSINHIHVHLIPRNIDDNIIIDLNENIENNKASLALKNTKDKLKSYLT